MIRGPEDQRKDSDHLIIRSSDHLKLFIIAGEASGDQLGAAVLSSLARLSPRPLQVRGIGGPLMVGAGLPESLFPMQDLSIMGIAEILPRLPHLIGRIHQTVAAIQAFQPDVVVTIDSPDFCFRVQRKIRDHLKTCQIHVVAPSVWAWRPGRAKKIAAYLDGLMCLFPFEPPYFERHGLKSIAMGHPVIGQITPRNPLTPMGQPLRLGLYPGSRAGVIHRHAPLMIQAIKKLSLDAGQAKIIIPTFDHLRPLIIPYLANLLVPYEFVTDAMARRAVMPTLDAALAVSGTVGLELAVAGVPHVVGYRMNAFTHLIARLLVRRGQRAHLANIILNDDVVPECIQSACTPDLWAAALLPLLADGPPRTAQSQAFATLRAALGAGETTSPGDKAAGFILELCSYNKEL